jgi:Xaa-Pro dipeptidase
MGYASDITRTIPVGNGGKYTEKAGAIYELVLRMQKVSWFLRGQDRADP